MTEHSRLDVAYMQMDNAPEDETARLQFYEYLAATELFVLLEAEAQGEQITPQTIDLYGEKYVLVFDQETRLTELSGGPAPYAAVSGRVLAQMLSGQDLGIALNIDVAPSSTFLPAKAIHWLNDTLSNAPQEIEKQLEKLFPPKGLPEKILTALDARLATATGLAHSAYLVAAAYQGGGQGHLLGFVDTVPGAEPALARAVADVLTFSGLEAAAIDVAFFAASDPITPRLTKVGLRFDLPQPIESPETPAPGTDPEKPPILK